MHIDTFAIGLLLLSSIFYANGYVGGPARRGSMGGLICRILMLWSRPIGLMKHRQLKSTKQISVTLNPEFKEDPIFW